jgi:hypothetical protein
MLTFFRTNQPLANLFLLVYLGVLRASTFLHPLTTAPRPQGILTAWMYAELPPLSIWGNVASFLLVFFQAVAINITVARYRVATEVSLLPGVFYCLVMSVMPDVLPLSSVLLANTFLILAVFYLFDTYKNSQVAGRIFDVGLWLGVASLFHFSYILFILWGIIGLGTLRGIRPAEFIMFIIGYTVPFFLVGVFCYWQDALPQMANHFWNNSDFLNFSKINDPMIFIKMGFVALLILITVAASGQFMSRRNMTVQKYLSILYWLMLLGGVSVLIQSNVNVTQILVVAVPLGILLSMAFQRISVALAESFHMLLFVLALILQYEYLLAGG